MIVSTSRQRTTTPSAVIWGASGRTGRCGDLARARRRRVAAGDRFSTAADALDGDAGGGTQRRSTPLSSLCRGAGGAAANAPAQALEAGGLRTAPERGGGQARAALVASADLGLAGRRVPRRAGDAGVPRDHLPVVVRAVPRRATQGALPLPAFRARHSPHPGPLGDERPGTAARDAQHQRAAGGG